MCGLIGIISKENQIDNLIECVKRLEYRGYDSFGIYNSSSNYLYKRVGSIDDEVCLESCGWSHADEIKLRSKERMFHPELFKTDQINPVVLLGHTRWATNGEVNEDNAHPHEIQDFVIVHNGIFNLQSKYKDHDTRNFLFLLEINYKYMSRYPEKAIVKSLRYLVRDNPNIGDNAALIYHKEVPGKIFVIITGNKELYYLLDGNQCAICSDINCLSLLNADKRWGIKLKQGIYICDINGLQSKIFGQEIQIPQQQIQNQSIGMLSEIKEQVELIKIENIQPFNREQKIYSDIVNNIPTFIGCGSSYNAGLFMKSCGLQCNVEYATEFKYDVVSDDTFNLYLTQSGTTQDILSCMEESVNCGQDFGIITNNKTLLNKNVIHIDCTPEYAVAATKSFTMTCLKLMELFGSGDVYEMNKLSKLIQSIIENTNLSGIVGSIKHYQHMLLLGTKTNYPVALEGALKIKEVACIHAEGMSAAEIKHGPIALIDDKTLSIFLINSDSQPFNSLSSNYGQIKSRDGKTLVICPASLSRFFNDSTYHICFDDTLCDNIILQSLGINVILQLLAYHLAVAKSLNPDRPRNLAKSVTV